MAISLGIYPIFRQTHLIHSFLAGKCWKIHIWKLVNAGASSLCRWASCKGSTTGTGGAPLHHVEGLQRVPGDTRARSDSRWWDPMSKMLRWFYRCCRCFSFIGSTKTVWSFAQRLMKIVQQWQIMHEQEKSIRDVSSRWGRTLIFFYGFAQWKWRNRLLDSAAFQGQLVVETSRSAIQDRHVLRWL